MADPARAKKIADRIKVLVAETLEYRVKDERLGFITITDVRVTGDLQNASVFYTVFGGEAERAETAAALESAKGKIRSAVGKGIGIRLTPTLEFIPDALPDGAAHMEDLLLVAKKRDAEVAAASAGATYAGDADPYRKPVDESSADDGSDTDTKAGTGSDIDTATDTGTDIDTGSDELPGRGDGALATDVDAAGDGAAQR
jgi:ribosome-binding factor A